MFMAHNQLNIMKNLTKIISCLFICTAFASSAMAEGKSIAQRTHQIAADTMNLFKDYNNDLKPLSELIIIEAEGKPEGNRGAYKASDIKNWEYVAVPKTGDQDHTFVQSVNNGVFAKPEYRNHPYLGTVFKSITEVKMTLHKAITLMRQAGYPGQFKYVLIRQPLSPTANETYYIFGFSSYHVFVGTDSGTVFTE